MAVVINTNSSATSASNNLAASNSMLQKSLNRLSSGSKIVNPADDAGGLAVSMKLSAAAKRSAAANSNIGNSTSYLQTQDGALKVAGKVLDRMSELKTLYTDPTKNGDDLANYDAEFTQLQTQLESLADETFNGVALFGSDTGLEVGVTESGGTKVTMAARDLADNATGVGALLSGTTTLTDQEYIDAGKADLERLAADYAALDAGSTRDGVVTEFTNKLDELFGANPSTQASTDAKAAMQTAFDDLVVEREAFDLDDSDDAALVAAEAAVSTAFDADVEAGVVLPANGGGSGADSLADISMSDISAAIQNVATMRASNGAEQSRLGFAGEVLTVNKANLEAANSRIVDVDVAEESTQLARWNTLVQAGTAMLSQANQSSQTALQLLR